MLNDPRITSGGAGGGEGSGEEDDVRDIHALTSPRQPVPPSRARRQEAWETSSHRLSSMSTGSEVSGENFTTVSREFNALVIAGSNIDTGNNEGDNGGGTSLARIGEDFEETNPLAIVPDNNPLDPVHSPPRHVNIQRVKKEETESKIMAWQNAKVAKVNNRFKREDAVINGWESEQIQKANSWMKKVERKLDDKRAKALEKMQNDIAKAHRKAEEKRATAEAKRGTKVTRILELANLMKVVGRAPSKRSFFSR